MWMFAVKFYPWFFDQFYYHRLYSRFTFTDEESEQIFVQACLLNNENIHMVPPRMREKCERAITHQRRVKLFK